METLGVFDFNNHPYQPPPAFQSVLQPATKSFPTPLAAKRKIAIAIFKANCYPLKNCCLHVSPLLSFLSGCVRNGSLPSTAWQDPPKRAARSRAVLQTAVVAVVDCCLQNCQPYLIGRLLSSTSWPSSRWPSPVLIRSAV